MRSATELVIVDADDLMEQVSRHLRRQEEAGETKSAVTFHVGPVPRWRPILTAKEPQSVMGNSTEVSKHLQALKVSFLSSLEPSIDGIGETPPYSATFRAWCGRTAIHFLQRLLWWYTAPIRLFAAASWKHFQHEFALLESLAEAHETAYREISAIREEVRQVKAHLEKVAGSPPQ
jgi:hypothetical protein